MNMKMKCAMVLGLVVLGWGWAGYAQEPVVFENECIRWVVGADGRNAEFVDKASGKDYADVPAVPHCASVKKAGQVYPASKVTASEGGMRIAFGESGVEAVLKVAVHPRHLVVEVASVSGEGIEELAFLDIGLTVAGKLDEPFAGCALALDLQTNVREIPGPNRRLRALCYPRFGMEGAEVAVIGSPMAMLRDVMKEAVSGAEEIPHAYEGHEPIGGPWALDADIGRGSYLFDFGSITESTVDDWVALVKRLGLNQVDFHTGKSLRFGDCRPHPELFPNGRASVKAVIDKLHAAGISAGLHTYAFFIAKDTPYVTPKPDPRLGKDATFTLSSALTAEADGVPVDESTAKMSTTTGFFVRNSVTLQIDDELITYSGVSKEAPFAFTGCTRGAYGTAAAAHEAGAKVHHLKECFGLFTPDADSTLLAEVAANAAETFNECGFDMIYLDALDGEDILAGGENSWHYGSKFVFEIAKRLEKPALFEMSTFHHHLWYVRARMGAWDHPSRWHKRFIDVHCAANQSGAGMFLPMNLGWWAVKTWQEGGHVTQLEPTFPDDIEYLMGKCLGNDMGFALMGVNPDSIDSVPAFQRLAPIFRQYEELRHAGYFPESVKARLREPGAEFTLEQAGEKWQLRPVEYAKHKVEGGDGSSRAWTVENRFAEQPAQLRIEVLMSAEAYESENGVVVEDFADVAAYADRPCREGVSVGLETSAEVVKTGEVSGQLTAKNTLDKAEGAWAKAGRRFTPPLNLSKQMALGVWVHGDGQGELLNVQLRSPEHTTSRGYGDHYVEVDFEGWRYFEMLEPEGGHIEDFDWPYGGGYPIYREMVDYGQVAELAFWFNNVPAGKDVACHVGPVKALPLVKATLVNPKVTIGGKTIVFPVEAESGSYLEFKGMDDCKLYDAKGALVKEVKPEGEAPVLAPGENAVTFECGVEPEVSARAYVTISAKGEAL